MKVTEINNAVKVSGIDLNCDDECRELGRIVASDCVVLVDDAVSEARLFDIHALWGQACRAILHRYVGDQRLSGRHWRSLLVSMGYTSSAVHHIADLNGMSRVSFERNKKGKPTGIFTNGELDWHSDQQSYHDNQRIVGLMSLWGTENSQTSFLCTAKAYAALNAEDKSMVDELVTVWNWDGGQMSKDLIASQKEIVRYNMVPYPNMECRLQDQTASGVKGIKFPSHCFSKFRGMSVDESQKYKAHLWSLLNKPEYIYTHDWKDGQIMFMDQNITLHARPTDVKENNNRTLCRMISYLDKLYPGNGPADYVMFGGKTYDHDTFAQMVDKLRRKEFYETRNVA